MIKLTPPRTEPLWVDLLPGVWVQVKPPAVIDYMMARSAASEVFLRNAEAPNDAKDPNVAITAGVAMTTEYARRTILEWEGIVADAGEPAPVTPETVEAVMQMWPFFSAFDAKVLTPALSLPAEGQAAGA